MALGDNNTNNNNYEITYYSRNSGRNYDLDKALSYSYWKGMLRLTISNVTKEGDRNKYDDIIHGCLTPEKARNFLSCIELYKKEDYSSTRSFGVDTGLNSTKTVVAITNKEFNGVMMTTLVIAKVDNSGNITEYADYPFGNGYILSWDNFHSMNYSKEIIKDADFNNFCNVLHQFINASTGATAYSVMDMGRFNQTATTNKLNDILDKLGIERRGKSNNSSSESFFNRDNNRNTSPSNSISESATLEDLLDA